MTHEKFSVAGIFLMIGVLAFSAACSFDAEPDRSEELRSAARGLDVVSLADGGSGKAVADELAQGGASVTDGRSEFPAVEAGMLVVMDSAWFRSNLSDPNVVDLIENAVNAGAGVVLSGSNTSQLYDLLKTLDLAEFAPGRNPAQSDPPMVGFWIETRTNSETTVHNFASSTDDTLSQAINAAKWIKGETGI